MTERLVLTVVMGVAVALCGYYYSKVVTRRRANRLPRSASRCLASAPRHSLRELQPSGQWVALCGTVFDVSGDPFFDASCAGVYSSWVNHEITYLILQLGLVLDAADDAKAIASYLDREWQVKRCKGMGSRRDASVTCSLSGLDAFTSAIKWWHSLVTIMSVGTGMC